MIGLSFLTFFENNSLQAIVQSGSNSAGITYYRGADYINCNSFLRLCPSYDLSSALFLLFLLFFAVFL